MVRGFLAGLFACLLLVLLVPVPCFAQASGAPTAAPDQADDKEARDLFQIGKEAFDEGRFERALKYFQEAYSLSHRAALLSNIGTALDRLRRDQEALDAYRKYLEQVPQAANRKLIEERIRIIEAALARSQPAPPAIEPIVAPTEHPPQPTAAKPEPAELLVPTPQETARASQSFAPTSDPSHPRDTGSTPVTSRWWFWTGIGAVAVAAVVVVVAVSAGGSTPPAAQPTLLDPQTRVREL